MKKVPSESPPWGSACPSEMSHVCIVRQNSPPNGNFPMSESHRWEWMCHQNPQGCHRPPRHHIDCCIIRFKSLNCSLEQPSPLIRSPSRVCFDKQSFGRSEVGTFALAKLWCSQFSKKSQKSFSSH